MGDLFGLWRTAQLQLEREVQKLQKALKENTPSNAWLLDRAASQTRPLAIENAEKGPPPQKQQRKASPSRPQPAPRKTLPRADSYRGRPLQPAEQLLLQRKDTSDGFDFEEHFRDGLRRWHAARPTREANSERAKEAAREQEERRRAEALALKEQQRQEAARERQEIEEAARRGQTPTGRPLTGREILYNEMKRANSLKQVQSSAVSAPIKREKSARRSPAPEPTTKYAQHFEELIEQKVRGLEQKAQKAREAAAANKLRADAARTDVLLAREYARAAERAAGDDHVAEQIAAQRFAEKKAHLRLKKSKSF
jgi:flagellar hook-basal body complex protein FliE